VYSIVVKSLRRSNVCLVDVLTEVIDSSASLEFFDAIWQATDFHCTRQIPRLFGLVAGVISSLQRLTNSAYTASNRSDAVSQPVASSLTMSCQPKSKRDIASDQSGR
jgi:hypothetical protein